MQKYCIQNIKVKLGASVKHEVQYLLEFFHDVGPYLIKTSSLIFSENQWTKFYMIGPSVMEELICTESVHLTLKF